MNSANKPSGGPLPDDHTRQIYERLPEDQKQKQTYTEWLKELCNNQYQKWMPWIEDMYLRWFGKGDNKASYVTKDTLSKSKVTGVNQVDQLQDDVHNLVGNQLGERGLLAPVGDGLSKHGVNRAERGGKDEDGSYGGKMAPVTDKGIDAAKNVGSSVAAGAKSVGGAFTR